MGASTPIGTLSPKVARMPRFGHITPIYYNTAVNNVPGLDQAYDWIPPDGGEDPIRNYDSLRERCPVAHSELQGWTLLRHADVLAALHDPGTFSSRVSTHVAVPNGMDGLEHAAFRAVIDRCFRPERVAAFAPQLRGIAQSLVAELSVTEGGTVDIMTALAEPYAARAQCAYLGWSTSVAEDLRAWATESREATRNRDREALDRVARKFDSIIVTELNRARSQSPASPRSLTHQLLSERVTGRPLTDEELVSIVRNWTAGELGTISAAVGIVVEFLARHRDVQAVFCVRPDLRQAAMDEMLRLEPPLVSNRRRTTRAVQVAGRSIPADKAVTILWPAVQHDPAVFAEPTEFRPDRDPADNLLYGRGAHYCPGEGLSRLELGMVLETLLAETPPFRLATEPVRSSPPAGGFAQVQITRSQPEPNPLKLTRGPKEGES